MRVRNELVLFLGLSLLACASAWAQGDGAGGGVKGGDICEDRFKTIRNDLDSWIAKGGAKGLQLPRGLSHEGYAYRMQNYLTGDRKARIRCVGPGDRDYPVEVYGAAKTCKNFQERTSGVII